MSQFGQRNPKRPGVAFAGFMVPFVLLVLVVLAYTANFFADIGWHGGEYADAFLGVVIGAMVVGAVLKLLPPRLPWTSFGTGLLLAGTLGVVIIAVLCAVISIALSHTNLPF
ncbi:MAG TPA: hypothetical protein VJT49_21365 [Amycolatopsis sp.]|uniref:hypothetical protein n=1 Tax=Amycolatopsis sp. TaxID=37632 RepID=UPI002B49F49D|nr:hypothetical protein [Amycolatopsis sp.]HKS47612.1 hypothetical protein [Amycolatopsis sp.]